MKTPKISTPITKIGTPLAFEFFISEGPMRNNSNALFGVQLNGKSFSISDDAFLMYKIRNVIRDHFKTKSFREQV
jgi:hypothetical protein